jgi:hypothetical protein
METVALLGMEPEPALAALRVASRAARFAELAAANAREVALQEHFRVLLRQSEREGVGETLPIVLRVCSHGPVSS